MNKNYLALITCIMALFIAAGLFSAASAKEANFNVSLSLNNNIIYPGEQITGSIYCYLSSNMKVDIRKKVRLKLFKIAAQTSA